MKGVAIADIRAHTALMPLVLGVGFSLIGACCYICKLATKNVECSWKEEHSEPWKTKISPQVKFYAPTIKYRN